MINRLKNINIREYIPRIIASWLISVNLISTSHFIYNLLIFGLSFILYSYLNKKFKKIHFDSLIILFNYLLSSLLWLKNFNLENNINYLLSVIIFLIFIIVYTVRVNKNAIKKLYISNKKMKILLFLFILTTIISSITIGVLRYVTFNSPNFDFGIFSHIFYNMKESLIPYTTCERNILLSHFAVHFSPILYLILPIYMIFSTPITLQVVQVLLLFSGIIPLIKLCNHFKLSKYLKVSVTFLYCFYPAITTGTFYDFHENCFLLMLLLWVFYFFEKGKNLHFFIFSILTLLVKEDAFIYLLIFSLYIIISKNNYKIGLKLLLLSIIYFFIVSYFMNKFGLGIMSDRYENLIFDNSGLIGAIKTIILNPGYVLKEMLTNPSNNFDKIIYLLKLFMPLSFIPFITNKTSRYILLVPVLINILTNYVYMYDITFHYSYGIIAFIFYLLILNIKDLNFNKIILYIPISLMITLISYYCLVIPTLFDNIDTYKNNKEDYKIINNALKTIPTDASVSSSTFYLPHLTNRSIMYETYYHENKLDIDYVVLDMRYSDELKTLEFYKNNGYNVILDKKELITILKKDK